MGEHSREVTAIITANEPPNGARLILDKGDEWIVIVRDDAEAKSWGQEPDERWFNAAEMNDGPMELHQFLKYAEAVYALGNKLANLDTDI
jgi:hypothetical protein